MNILANVTDWKTTIQGLWGYVGSAALLFGVQVPSLPGWLLPLIGILGTLLSTYHIFGVKAAPAPTNP